MSQEMEFVWVVRREDLFPKSSPHGFEELEEGELEERYLGPMRRRGFFVERREAEKCPAWKQVIPYVLVRYEDQYLLLTRLQAQSEARLHGLQSLGVGGHINPIDADSKDEELLWAACHRELEEELHLDAPYTLRPLGLINDDTTEVGSVHVGLVFEARCSAPPEIRETEKMKGALTPLAGLRDLCQTLSALESWSRFLLMKLVEFDASEFGDTAGDSGS